MSIEKFLDQVNTPNNHPGPIAVKLKYDIKKRILLRKRKQQQLFTIAKYANVILLLFVVSMIINPDYALVINRTFTANTDPKEQSLHAETQDDNLPLSEEGVYLGSGLSARSNNQSHIIPVSTGGQAAGSSSFQIMDLSELEDNTPYIIRKINDRNNRSIYFVNEIATLENRSRIPY